MCRGYKRDMGIIDQFISSKSLSDCFSDALPMQIPGKLRALIVPHAGYIYSGSVAASGYRLMKAGDYDRVIIVGFYHGGAEEHSVKIQIPFIYYILGKNIIIEEKYVEQIINLYPDERTLVVASSDLSHYYPLPKANQLDRQSIDAILSLDESKIRRQTEACGLWPILTVNKLANRYHWQAQLIDYRTSAEASGDPTSVVGYASIAYYEPKK
mgnify:CR=1 FL=1